MAVILPADMRRRFDELADAAFELAKLTVDDPDLLEVPGVRRVVLAVVTVYGPLYTWRGRS